jgi:polyphosphate kinase 2 (PPK2 family)
VPIKFFLHVSKQEQQKRLLNASMIPPSNVSSTRPMSVESKLWDQYMQAHDDMIRETATEDAPWYVVPADHKWFIRLVVAAAIVEQRETIDPKFPTLDAAALCATWKLSVPRCLPKARDETMP